MIRPQPSWQVFRRLHLAVLAADWRRTLLSVIGVAIGVSVVLGVLILKAEMLRPFDAFGPALVHAADRGVVQVSPRITGRLPVETVHRLREEVPGAQAVIPVVAELTPVAAGGVNHGFLLLGGSCQVELLIGPFGCDPRAAAARAPGAPIPLAVASVIAGQNGLRPGTYMSFPGLSPSAAQLVSTFADFDRVRDINHGDVLLAPSAQMAAEMVGTPGYVTTVFVLPKPGATIEADIDRVVAGVATAGPPRPQTPTVLTNAAQSFNLTAMAGVLIGFMIAVNTVLLAIENRRPILGTVAAIGARPSGLLGGLLAEGALVGAAGGLVAVLPGYFLGSYLVDKFGRSMLAGSGGTLTARLTPDLIVTAIVAGVLCGVLAMVGPVVRLAREGPLTSMASFGGVQRIRTISWWPLGVGVALLTGSVVVLTDFGRGAATGHDGRPAGRGVCNGVDRTAGGGCPDPGGDHSATRHRAIARCRRPAL
jgi:putative ABC transport system permease protein